MTPDELKSHASNLINMWAIQTNVYVEKNKMDQEEALKVFFIALAMVQRIRGAKKFIPDGEELAKYPPEDMIHRMQPMARVISDVFHDSIGFFLFCTKFGEAGRGHHVTNIAPETLLPTLKEFIERNPDDINRHTL